jgi:hypothetical protein
MLPGLVVDTSDVDVRVDQSREQVLAARIEHRTVDAGPRNIPDLGDDSVNDGDADTFDRITAVAIDYRHVLDHQIRSGCHGRNPFLRDQLENTAEKRPGTGFARGLEYIPRAALLHDSAVIHEHERIADLPSEADLMCDDDHCHSV